MEIVVIFTGKTNNSKDRMKRNSMKKVIFAMFTVLYVVLGFNATRFDIRIQDKDKFLISPEKFKKETEKRNADTILIDVRTPEEYNDGHIGGAILIDFKKTDFKEKLETLNKEKVYYIYCRSGRRSGNSKILMNEIGIKEVYDLQGGILAWKAKEYPVKKGDKE